MAVTKFLARDLTIEVSSSFGSGSGSGGSGSGGGPYTPIKGLNTLTHSPSSSDAVTTDFDSNGRAEHMKAERGDSWTLAGFTLEDVMTGSRDPGQALVEALALEVGLTSKAAFRITSPGGNTIEFSASAEVTLGGGGNNDAATWQAVIECSGPVQFA